MKQQINRRVWTVAAVALALGVTFAAVGQAQTARGRGRTQNAPRMEKQKAPRPMLAEKLKLSDAQKEQLAELRTQAREDAILRRGKMADLRAQMKVEFMKDTVDKAKVRSLEKDIQALRDEGSSARLEHRLSMLDVFTADQRKELKKFRSEAPGRMGMHGRGMMGRHGRGMMRGRGHGMQQGPMMHPGMRGGCGMQQGRGQGMQGAGPGMHPGWGMRQDARPDASDDTMIAPGCPMVGPELGVLMDDGFGPVGCAMASTGQ
jgi:Spy/CpxP family protein refolding chaperone